MRRRQARRIPARKDERCGGEKGAGDDRRVAKGGEEGGREEQDGGGTTAPMESMHVFFSMLRDHLLSNLIKTQER